MRKFLGILGILGALVGLSSCNSGNNANYTREIVYNGSSYMLPEKVEKAVVMDLGFIDIIDELNVEVELAIPDASLPSYLEAYADNEKIGGLKTPNEEAIVIFEPDVIILGGRQSSYVDAFSKIAPTILLSQGEENAIDYVYKNLELACDIFGLDEKQLEEKKNAVETKIAEVKELTSVSTDKGLILLYNNSFSAFGAGSRFGIIHDVFGVLEADESIDVSTHGQQMSPEQLLQLNPDRIFVIDRTIAIDDGTSSDLFTSSIYDKLIAKQNDKITYLDPVVWYTISGGYQALFIQIENVYNAYLN